MGILEEKTGRISHCDVVFENQNIVKPRLVFLAMNRNAEILSEGFNDRF